MSNLTMPRIPNYAEASELLGDRDERKLCYDTSLVRLSKDHIAVRYFDTDIVTFRRDDSTVIDTDDHQTSTTKTRINRCLPEGVHVYQRNWTWYISDRAEHLFYDGITVCPSGAEVFAPAI